MKKDDRGCIGKLKPPVSPQDNGRHSRVMLTTGGAILFTFFANFPRKLFRARWPWIVIWGPPAVVALSCLWFFYRMVYGSGVGMWAPTWVVPLLVASNLTLGIGSLVALVLNYRRLEEANERRRVRLIVAGAVVTELPWLWVLGDAYLPAGPASLLAPITKAITLVYPVLYLAFPAAMAHAILRHRLFDIGVMIRQGLQYALARRALVSAPPAVAGLLLLDLLIHRDQPPELWDLFATRAEDHTHVRVHPLLDWTELDVWRYIRRENLPVVDLYFSREGKRYRSIGCAPCCEPIESEASTLGDIIRELETTRIAERQGRAQDKEAAYAMQQLRALGYM